MESHGIHPVIAGEFKDSALMKAFGQAGVGVFAGPSAIEKEIRAHYQTPITGPAHSVTECFYAISVQRKLNHPAVSAIRESARGQLFATPGKDRK